MAEREKADFLHPDILSMSRPDCDHRTDGKLEPDRLIASLLEAPDIRAAWVGIVRRNAEPCGDVRLVDSVEGTTELDAHLEQQKCRGDEHQ